MPNVSCCACHVFADKSTLDSKQNEVIDGFLRVLHEDLPYFERFKATRVTDEYLRLCYETKESHASAVWPPLSRLSGVADGETRVFLLTFANESFTWNDRCAKIQVLLDDGDERVSDLAPVSQDEFAEAVKRFAAVLVAPRQAVPGSYEIDCTAMVEKAKQPPKEATCSVLQARPNTLGDLDLP